MWVGIVKWKQEEAVKAQFINEAVVCVAIGVAVAVLLLIKVQRTFMRSFQLWFI